MDPWGPIPSLACHSRWAGSGTVTVMGSEGSEQSRDSSRNGNVGRGNDAGQGSNAGRGNSGQPSDPIGDFQRWLMKAGARSLGREVADRVRSTVTGGKRSGSSDVWDTATTEPPPDEAPECAWCPICRAARRYRDSGGTAPGGGLGSQLAGVSDTLAGLAQDAFGIFEQALRTTQRPPARPSGWPAGSSPAPGSAPAASAPPGAPSAGSASATGTGWPDPSVSGSAPSGAVPTDTPPSDAPTSGTAPADAAPAGGAPSGGVSSGGARSDDGPVVGAPVAGRAAVHPQDQDGEAADEGGDRDERGEAGDGPAASGGDDQVERPAE